MGELQPAKPVLVGTAPDERLRSSGQNGRRLREIIRVAINARQADSALVRNRAACFGVRRIRQRGCQRNVL